MGLPAGQCSLRLRASCCAGCSRFRPPSGGVPKSLRNEEGERGEKGLDAMRAASVASRDLVAPVPISTRSRRSFALFGELA
eukprot:scaffold22805_cov59-Phaeocystis_antarctica.AAC.11